MKMIIALIHYELQKQNRNIVIIVNITEPTPRHKVKGQTEAVSRFGRNVCPNLDILLKWKSVLHFSHAQTHKKTLQSNDIAGIRYILLFPPMVFVIISFFQ